MVGFGLGNIGGFAAGAASGAASALQGVLLLAIIGFIGWMIYEDQRYKKVRGLFVKLTGSGKRVWDLDRAKISRSKKKGNRWKFKKRGWQDPPPDDLQELGQKGTVLVYGIEDSYGNITWIDPNITHETIKTQLGDFKPITNNDKRALRYEIELGQKYRENLITKMAVPVAFGFLAVVMMAVFLLFWGRAVEPLQEAAQTTGSNLQEIQETEKAIAEIQRETAAIKAGIQRIEGGETPLRGVGGNETGVVG